MKNVLKILFIVLMTTFLFGCGGYFQIADDWRGPDIHLQIVNALPHQLNDVVINGVSLKQFYPDTSVHISNFNRGDWDNIKLGWQMIRSSPHDWWGRRSDGQRKLRVHLQIIGYFTTADGETIMLLPRGARPDRMIVVEEERPALIIFDKTSYKL